MRQNVQDIASKQDCSELQAGEACIATVTWSPQQKGPSTGVLVIKHNGPTGVSSVALSGDYAPDTVDEAEIFPEAIPGKGLLVSSQTREYNSEMPYLQHQQSRYRLSIQETHR